MGLGGDLAQALVGEDVVTWADRVVAKNELGQPFAFDAEQRLVLGEMFRRDAAGRYVWETLLYSAPKKSGKTTINAVVTLWWARTQEPPNEIVVVANDQEQAVARVFDTMGKLLAQNPGIDPGAEVRVKSIRLSNGTTVQAIATDAAGEAGANLGWSSWDELWGVTSEKGRRLYEELTPVPTRQHSLRFISTYAGWEGESTLLWDLYLNVVGSDEHPLGRGERLHPTIPLYGHRAARVCAYWTHETRMPWQTERYYAGQQATLRPGTFLRLHRNQWVSAESIFLTPEMWDPCVHQDLTPSGPDRRLPVYVGVDASITHDTSAVVVVTPEPEGRVRVVTHRIWQPTREAPMDLEETVEAWLREIAARWRLVAVYGDPYQMHRSFTTLRKAGLPVEDYAQTVGNLTRAGQQLYDLLMTRRLRTYPDRALRAQALATVAIESPRGWRIAKEKASRKIDGIVALAMACVAAVEGGAPVEARWLPIGT